MDEPQALFDSLNSGYLAVHERKEELYWAVRMATSSDHEGLARAEGEYKAFVSDPGRLAAVRSALSELERRAVAGQEPAPGLVAGLRGWQALFEANVIEDPAGREAMARVIELESALFAKRRSLVLRHLGEAGVEEEATLGSLLTNEAANPDEAGRRSSLLALRGLEAWVLSNGLLEIVAARNAFARG